MKETLNYESFVSYQYDDLNIKLENITKLVSEATERTKWKTKQYHK